MLVNTSRRIQTCREYIRTSRSSVRVKSTRQYAHRPECEQERDEQDRVVDSHVRPLVVALRSTLFYL